MPHILIRYTALALASLALFSGGPAVAKDALGLEGPDEALEAMRKIQCTTDDGVPVTYGWEGRTFSRVPGEPENPASRWILPLPGYLQLLGVVSAQGRGSEGRRMK